MTWNPTTGCDKISDGCKFCYAEIMAKRLKSIGVEKYANGFNLTIHADELQKPYLWKTPKKIFVNSMSDLFHKDVPVDFIQKVFLVIKENPRHIFQILTKRADVLLDYDKKKLLEWTHNLWMGVTVENEKVTERINLLRQTDVQTKFLSCEPLLSPLPNLNLEGIDLVIVGGESGKTPRPMKKEWVMEIKEQCEKNKVAFFFKQWGGTDKKKTGNLLDGKKYLEMPKLKEKYCGPLWAQQL